LQSEHSRAGLSSNLPLGVELAAGPG
jgi:hypothetical protein